MSYLDYIALTRTERCHFIELCNDDFSYENVSEAVKAELGSVCYRILENTAVFKDDTLTIKFMEDLGFYGN